MELRVGNYGIAAGASSTAFVTAAGCAGSRSMQPPRFLASEVPSLLADAELHRQTAENRKLHAKLAQSLVAPLESIAVRPADEDKGREKDAGGKGEPCHRLEE